MKVLLGYTGLVGSNLNHAYFDVLLNSSNFDDFIAAKLKVNEMWIAAGDARKWVAIKDPLKFKKANDDLLTKILGLEIKKLILFSSIDVYEQQSMGVETDLPENDHPYGVIKYETEKILRHHFPHVNIIRLPGLFGRNLKKNFIYDLIERRREFIGSYNEESTFQYYDLSDLHDFVIKNDCELVNLATEPVSVRDIYTCYREVSHESFSFIGEEIVRYNVRTLFTDSGYFICKKDVLIKLNEFFRENIK